MATDQRVPGLLYPGNIDLMARPITMNHDGSYSTVKSMSFGTDDGEVLVPLVGDDGRIMTPDEAIDTYRKTGKHLGIFNNPDTATAYAEALHNSQSDHYAKEAERMRALIAGSVAKITERNKPQ